MINSLKNLFSCFDFSISMAEFNTRLNKRNCKSEAPTGPRLNHTCLRNKHGIFNRLSSSVRAAVTSISYRCKSGKVDDALFEYQEIIRKKKPIPDVGETLAADAKYGLEHVMDNTGRYGPILASHNFSVLRAMERRLVTMDCMNPDSADFDPLIHMHIATAINVKLAAPKGNTKGPTIVNDAPALRERHAEKQAIKELGNVIAVVATDEEKDAAIENVLHTYPVMSLENRSKVNKMVSEVSADETGTAVTSLCYDVQKFPKMYAFDSFVEDVKRQIADLASEGLKISRQSATKGDAIQQQMVAEYLRTSLQLPDEAALPAWQQKLVSALIGKEVARIVSFSDIAPAAVKSVRFAMPVSLEE